ncbi:MAG TPA: formylglycine-generating enzyme family protein [Verrucomicrobiae bacterium]|nr:formylglycine-generating enzyme family protein [Verrucomicrobiae bacterium]
MKAYSFLAALAVSLVIHPPPAFAAVPPPIFVYENSHELFGRGDFDGDGRQDVVIIDKLSGKYRLGYQSTPGTLSWVDCRPTAVTGITGLSIGHLFAKDRDAMVMTAPDANQFVLLEAASPTAPSRPLKVSFTAGLGPSSVVAVDAGGATPKGLLDLFVGSIYNSPDPNLATLLRNDGAEFPKISEATLPGVPAHGNRFSLKAGQPELLCLLLSGDSGDTFRTEDLSSGKPVIVASVSGLPAGSDYAVGNFGGSPLREVVFYKPGKNSLSIRPVEESGGQLQFGQGGSFDMGEPVQRVITLDRPSSQRLLIIFGDGQKAAVCDFDGVKAPSVVQTLLATNNQFTFAASLPEGFVLFSQPSTGKFSNKYQVYKSSGSTYVPGPFGTLPTLEDNDNITIPDIYSHIMANNTVTNESQMKPYTNTIPGTRVKFVMEPIPAGEFIMGSPDNEAGRKPDEGPQHKVKISPFWMEQCEVTWNEYELFMYPDEERRMRTDNPGDNSGDKLADAVTHPSKPYVEMSFGMGKDGFPAISMTQHAANKYCQWLSAKTGQFYRLPTEAEWEYACRAGTTTAYFFGNDPTKLSDYAWFEDNSDFKYQKVGKKKPNPWGLYDTYGNVVEWVLDQYDPGYYAQCAKSSLCVEPWNKATKPYPHSVRGGSWDDPAVMCRSAARRGSDRSWKMTDPQLPKSIWYFSDAQWVGFRIIRPLQVPTAEEMQKYWTSGTEKD